jgi:5-(carboxyamino)imidazole ribonucleotide synthase
MFAIAAREMGYRVHTYSPDTDTPTGQVADLETVGAYDDLESVRRFAKGVSAVTFEFENVPAATAEACASIVPVRPAGEVLHISQHRLREKTFLNAGGFPVVPHAIVRSAADLQAALDRLGTPAVLKTAGWGYDGKGQIKISSPAEAASAWDKLATREAVLEAYIDFAMEISVVAARATSGQFTHWGAVENHHHHHILDVSISPARIPAELAEQAVGITRLVLEKLGVVGVLCVEFFVTKDHQLLINELAPRPHNSGHFTINASRTSQFAQQVRAVCDLPLGDTSLHSPSAMVNLLGDLWKRGEPQWHRALALPGVSLHLYGKADPRPGRKMGHLTALAPTPDEAAMLALTARRALTA